MLKDSEFEQGLEMLQAGHICLPSGRFLQVSLAGILSNSLGSACFGLRVFL